MSEGKPEQAWLQASEALFRAPLKAFVAERKALSTELTRAGQRDVAARLRGLSKPSVVAWLANQLYYSQPDAWDAALAAGHALRGAQANSGTGAADLQALMADHRQALQRLLQLAVSMAQQAELSFNRSHERQLQETLEAVANGVVAPAAFGRLVRRPGPGSEAAGQRPACRVAPCDCSQGALARSGLGDFHHPAPPLSSNALIPIGRV